MRVVLDTNVVVSALLFSGPPRALLRRLCNRPFELWTSRSLLRELPGTLAHRKLRSAVGRTGMSVALLVQAYAQQTLVVSDAVLPEVVFTPDPGDADVIAAARAARARWLVTGDRHLLDHREEAGCEVLALTEALRLCED